MRGMGGILDSLSSLLGAMGVTLPPWAFPVIALVVAFLLLPRIVGGLETGRARRILKRSRVVEGEARAQMEAEALRAVKDRPMGLVAVAEEALRLRRGRLAREAVEQLARTGKAKRHLRRLIVEIDPAAPLPPTADAAAAVLERLIEGGMNTQALERLRRFERAWPDHPALVDVGLQVRAAQTDARG